MDALHETYPRPIFGLRQVPETGLSIGYRFAMGRRRRDPEIESAVDVLLDTVAANVKYYMDERVDSPNRVAALAKRAGLGKGTIQRVLGGSKGYAGQKRSAAALDTIVYIAAALELPLAALFASRDRKSRLLAGLDLGSEQTKPTAF